MKHRIAVAVPSLVAVGAMLSVGAAYGAGFALMEHSVQGIGRSYAGSVAGAELESSIYYNPAGIASAGDASVSVSSHLLMTSVDFDGGSSYPATGGTPLAGGDGGEAGVNTFVPNLYIVGGIAENVAVGLGIFVPFGLATEYNDGWVGRYHALNSALETVNINPTIAWQVSEKLSVGAGVSAQYASATLSSAIDFGTISGVAPGLLDGEGTMTGDDWGYGYDVGVIYAFAPESRFGLSYRSAIEHTLEGDAEFYVPAPVIGIQALNQFVNTTGRAELELPASASLGGLQELNDKVTVMFDVSWTEWSSLDELRIEYDSAQADSVTDESWKDTWRVTVGGEYAASDAWVLRAGTAFDESPIPDDAHRTPRIPDSDRFWLTGGIGYRSSEHLSVDFGYAHVFSEDAHVDRTSETGDRLVGDYEGAADVFSFQVKWSI
jgi:long-chain fatty acid transport protein